jgi:hypothetical protein
MKTCKREQVARLGTLRLQRHVSALLKDIRVHPATVKGGQNKVQFDAAVRGVMQELLNGAGAIGPYEDFLELLEERAS